MTRASQKVAREIADVLETHGDIETTPLSPSRATLERWLLLLSPPRKPRRKQTKARASVRELDKLCREVVFARDGNKCRKCGRTERLQWCHVYSRRYKWLRWDLDNSFCGCARCHLEWHHRPADGAEWWCGQMKERWTPLVRRAGKPQKADMGKWKLYLLQEKKKYL